MSPTFTPSEEESAVVWRIARDPPEVLGTDTAIRPVGSTNISAEVPNDFWSIENQDEIADIIRLASPDWVQASVKVTPKLPKKAGPLANISCFNKDDGAHPKAQSENLNSSDLADDAGANQFQSLKLDNIHRGPWFKIHRSFVPYVLHTVGLNEGPSNEIAQFSKQWAQWDSLTSLANYHFVVRLLFGYLEESSNLHRASAVDVSNRLSQDITAVLDQINSILTDHTTYKQFLSCRGMVAQLLLDLLQDLLDSSHELRSRPLISKALLRLSGECGLHPTCFTLVGLKKVGQQVAGGGFGDIWKGSVGGQTVAVKSMRQFMDDDVRISLKKLGREALIWRQFSHPNLLPFFGLYVLDNRPSLISPWMDNGDLKSFLNNAPNINRRALIADVAKGLEYLHSNNVVHGDLKTANIMVTPSGRACIADFGLSSIVDELSLKITFSSRSGWAGTVRYQAPELLTSERSSHFGSDVYAFACVCYEILTGKVPFFEVANEMAIAIKVINEGARPSKPVVISPEYLWLLVDDCWRQKADERPTMAIILQRLRQPIEETMDKSPPDWDNTYCAKFRRSVQEWPLLPSIAEIERRIPSLTMSTHDSTLVATGPPNLVEAPPKKLEFRLGLAPSLKDQGNKAFAAKDYDKAIELFTQAIALDPKNHVLFSNRSAAYAGKRQWADALTDAEQCVALNPSWSKGYARKGAALHAARRYDEAIATYHVGLWLENSPALRKGLEEVEAARAVAEKEATWLTLSLCESPT